MEKFPNNNVRLWFRNNRNSVLVRGKDKNKRSWKNVIKVKVYFEKEKCYTKQLSKRMFNF